jgi:dUTP pyrophosphatase
MPKYEVGDKIGQIKIGATFPIEFIEVDSLDSTERGDGGFGSTGK